MKLTLRLIGVLGFALFALLFLMTFGIPGKIEQSAKGFVSSQIERELSERYEGSAAENGVDAARSLAGKLGIQAQGIQEDLRSGLAEKIAEVVAVMCDLDCGKKKTVADSITRSYLDKLANLTVAKQTLSDVIKGKYVEIIEALKLDLRIFVGTNAAMFLILLLVSFVKPQAIAHLFLPGVLLFASTIAASAIYIFGQDWFYTIIYNNYMGFGYVAWVAVLFGFLMDIVFNAARITTKIINAILNMIGSAFSVVPC